MLKIRSPQLAALRAARALSLMPALTEHVREFFPQIHAASSTEELSTLIRHGVVRACELGAEREDEIFMFVDLTVGLGPDFERSERYPWAARVLADETYPPAARIHRLYDVAILALQAPA